LDTFGDRNSDAHDKPLSHAQTIRNVVEEGVFAEQAGQTVTVHVAAETITIDLDDQDSRTVRRTTTQPVRSIKAAQSRKAAHVS
jgi:hypothetical protein